MACFMKMKYWKEQIHLFEETNGHGVNKADFAKVQGTACLKALMS
jgi:hypothetical protein